MREVTSGMRLGVCLGAILLVFAGGTTSNLPEGKLLGLVERSDNLESSAFVLTSSTSANQDEKKEEERNTNYYAEKNKEEEEIETTTIVTTTMRINGTNRDIMDEFESVTTPAMVAIESTTSSQILDNELDTFDRTGRREDISHVVEKNNASWHHEETKMRDPTTTTSGPTLTTSGFTMTTNVPTTTSVPTTATTSVPATITTTTAAATTTITTSIPTTTMPSSSSSENAGKRVESNDDSTILTTTIRDTSIYENTIGRKDSEKKPIVTEPSVVLENSIQQSGSGYRLNNVTKTSTSSISSNGTTESTTIDSSTKGSIGTLTSETSLSYASSVSEDPSEKADFTGNGITENSSPITGTQTSRFSASSNSSISNEKIETSTIIVNVSVPSDNYYSTISTSDANFSPESTIESSNISNTSIEPTNSLSSTSASSAVEYEFVSLPENGTNVIATTSSRSIENSSSIRDSTPFKNDTNLSNTISSTKSLSETASWPRMMTEVISPGTLSPSTSNAPSIAMENATNVIANATSSTKESTIVATTVGSTTESLDTTPTVNIATLDIPSGTAATTIRDKLPTGKKATDIATSTTTTEAPPSDDVVSFVRIVFEGNWQDICPRLEEFRQYLAKFLAEVLARSFTAKQIRFHRNPCYGPLTDGTLFSIFVYIVGEDGKFDGETTKNLPDLYKSNASNSPIKIHSLLLVQETDSSNAIAVVVVSSVAFICLLLLAGLLFVMRKRQTRFNYGERCRPVSLDAYSLDSVSAYNSVRRKGATRSSKRSYGNPAFEDSSAIPSHPLTFAGLSTFSNDIDAINEEFTSIPQVSAKMDELPLGAEVKNRYANVIPLPESRVPLRKLNDDPLSEYINANYVRGPKNATKYYIACQAPLDTTVTDFWRMIWEQQCKVIIMLTDLVENGVEKCTEYVPPSEVTDCHRLYGDFQVTLKKRETKEKYVISTLYLKNLENNTFREVHHIWYLWPTTGLQSDGAGLIAVLLEARALQRGGPGPIVVHCSPGTGRTGTLIALDLGIRQYEITRTVDVPRVVYTIRRDRAGAVQTKEQYAFVYKALNLYATKLAGGMLESS